MFGLSPVMFAFLLTLFAGLSTGIGSALAFFTKKTNTKLLSVALGFSAGVMIYVSFMEILPKGEEALAGSFGEGFGALIAVISFFFGVLVAAIIDKLIPSFENCHEVHRVEEIGDDHEAKKFRKLHRAGYFMALAIAIHNFPEGIATFMAALSDPGIGIAIAIAVAIHNIPEGIAVAIPLFYATGDRAKSFFYSFLSGLAEPFGALVGFLILYPFLSPTVFGLLFAGVAGIMVFISLDELLPAAREYGHPHLAIYGVIAGMAVMAASLLLLA